MWWGARAADNGHGPTLRIAFFVSNPQELAFVLPMVRWGRAPRIIYQRIIIAADRAFDGNPSLDFISLALEGKKIGMEKVNKLIDDLVAELKQDQINDDSKKEYCAVQFGLTDDKKKGLDKSISDLETAIVEGKDGILTLKDEIDALRLSVFYTNGHT